MTVPSVAGDRSDARLAIGATGLLRQANDVGVLAAADVHVATTLGRLTGERDERVLLAVALAVRGVREGSVCIDLAQARTLAAVDADAGDAELPWPEFGDWYAACSASPLIAVGPDGDPNRPVRVIDRLLYLDRYWRQEELVRDELQIRAARPPRDVNVGRLRDALEELFPGDAPDHQRLAAAAGALGSVTIVAGGPGTGKTTTIARMLAVLEQTWDTPPRVALAAPTGKAAARMQEAIAAESQRLESQRLPSPGERSASTLHRLLGSRPDNHTRFRHNRENRLPYDVVVVDETSMVSLTLMSRLLEAVRAEASLVLVGDPDQLASVEAGAVLGDLVHRPERSSDDQRYAVLSTVVPDDLHPADEVTSELRRDVVRLRTTYRFRGAIAALADAIRRGRADDAITVLSSADPSVEFVTDPDAERREPADLGGLYDDVVAAARTMVEAARAGDMVAAISALERHRLLCAHRRGPYGVTRWTRQVERWLAREIDGYTMDGEWYVGRPLLVTANDYEVGLYNGDTGVVVAADPAASSVVAAFGRGGEPIVRPTNRLSAVSTVHAMTVHRSQGSQFDRVSVLLPPPESPLLTRELLYTAVTRAASFVRVIGAEAAVRAAVERPIQRASGLRLAR